MSGKILFLDTETTGLDKENNEVIEIAMQFYDNGMLKSEFQVRMKRSATKLCAIAALKVNKYLSWEKDSLDERAEAAEQLVKYLLSLPTNRDNPISIGGHNVAGDIRMIQQFLKEFNYTGWEELFSYRVKDTSTVGEFLRDCGILVIERMNLGALAKSLKITFDKDNLHGAMFDTQITASCYYEMIKLLKELNLDANNMRTIMSLEEKDVHGT